MSRRKSKPEDHAPRSAATRTDILKGFQIHSQTGVAQDYFNVFLPQLFIDQLVKYATNASAEFATHLSIAREKLQKFSTYRDYLRSGLMASGYTGRGLSKELNYLMNQLNAAQLEAASQRIRANLSGDRIDVADYLSNYKEILTLIYGRSPTNFRDDAPFISDLDKIFNG